MSEDLVGVVVLEPAEVAPLLGAIKDPSAEVRVSAFEALTRLPLTPADWVKVGDHVEWALDSGASLAEKIAVVRAAPWIPVRSVRERVTRLAEVEEGEVREQAIRAMASFNEPATAELLSTDIGDPEADRLAAVQRLAMVGASGNLDDLRHRCHSVPKDDPIRPWLALTLARSGEDDELRAFFGDVLRGEAAWYVRWDERALWVLANSPLPAKTVQWLSLLPQAAPGGGEPGEAPTALVWFSTKPPGFTTASVSELAGARDLLLKFGILNDDKWPTLDNRALEAMAAAAEGALTPAVITVWFGMPLMIGNAIVEVVQRIQPHFRPDLEGLFAAYRGHAAVHRHESEELFARYSQDAEDGGAYLRTAISSFIGIDTEGGPRSVCYQIGWTVSRGGLRGLVPGLATHLTAKDPAERMAAAYLIADAADYALRPYGPFFGGGSGPRRRLAPGILVDDSAQRHAEGAAVDAIREGDRVECSVFAPPTVWPGSTFLIQAFAHISSQTRDAERRAKKFDADSVQRAIKTLEHIVSRGTKLAFDLTMRGLQVRDPVQSMVWLGTTESVQFEVSIPRRYPLGNVIGTITICQGPIPIGHIKFTLKVTASPAAGHERRPQSISAVGEAARRYEMAFISYASEDRTRVLERVQVLSAVGVRTFQDVLDLEPGERWESSLYRHINDSDVVLLFWSNAAKRSKWVRKEVRYALDRKQGDDFASPEIRPVIIEGPPVPRPWKELAHLHFNDPKIYLMDR